jgi:alpha-galactosidase
VARHRLGVSQQTRRGWALRASCVGAIAQLSCGTSDLGALRAGEYRSVVDGSVAPPLRDSGPGDTAPPHKDAAAADATPPDACSVEPPKVRGALPLIGWSVRSFHCSHELDQSKFMAMVDALQVSGMQASGYRYVNFESCWQPARTTDGALAPDSTIFPGGVAMLGHALHDRGFQLGLAANRGTSLSCGGGADSSGREADDAALFVGWGADGVTYNECGGLAAERRAQVEAMAAALKSRSPAVLFALGSTAFEDWMPTVAQSWRSAPASAATWTSILAELDANAPLAPYAHYGAWNDLDVLQLGNGSLTESESRAQLTLWAMMSAPLMASNDLTVMSETTRAMLTRGEILALDQDALGLQAARIRDDTVANVQVFAKPLARCGARAVAVLNRGLAPATVNVDAQELWLDAGPATARDLWDRAGAPVNSGEQHMLSVTVPPHDVRAFEVVGGEPALVRGDATLSDVPFTYAANFYGPVERNLSNGELLRDGVPLKMRGHSYAKGLGVHAPSLVRYRLGPGCTRFSADVGVDDEVAAKGGSVVFEVWSGGNLLASSGVLTGQSPVSTLDVPLSGQRELRLFVGNAGDGTAYDHADWADARVQCPP